MVAPTEAESGDPTEEHLYPAGDGHDLPNDPVARNDMTTYAGVYALCEVQLEVYAQYDLKNEH